MYELITSFMALSLATLTTLRSQVCERDFKVLTCGWIIFEARHVAHPSIFPGMIVVGVLIAECTYDANTKYR